MVTIELSDREALLLAGVIDDAIIAADIEVDILELHYPSAIEDIEDVEYDLSTLYDLSEIVDNAIWFAEVGA